MVPHHLVRQDGDVRQNPTPLRQNHLALALGHPLQHVLHVCNARSSCRVLFKERLLALTCISVHLLQVDRLFPWEHGAPHLDLPSGALLEQVCPLPLGPTPGAFFGMPSLLGQAC